MMDQQATPSTSQQAANQLFDSLAAEQQRAIAERLAVPPVVTRKRTVSVALAIAVPTLIVLLWANSTSQTLASFLEPTPPPAIARQQAWEMLDALVVEIETFRRSYDELPESLVEIGVPPRGNWDYTATDDTHYRVQGRLHGQVVRFDSTSAVKGQP